jgi:periplasmic divalent cation tolerance protein
MVILCTTAPDESEPMAKHLVEQGLAACVSVFPVQSYYRWKGAFCADREHLIIAKTTSARVDNAIDAIRAMHSYDVPEIIAVPVRAGHAPYLDWVRRETARRS